jgi:hypothetical protein
VIRIFQLISLLFLVTSCSFFGKEVKPEAVARVENSYLYKDKIENLVPPGTSKEDSITIVQSFIDRWASQELLKNASEVNLNKAKINEFDELIEQYRSDLYTKAYLEQIVQREIDTVVTPKEIEQYYKENKENFRANDVLVKLRYIQLPKDHLKFETIKSKFFDYKKSDKNFWDTYQLQMKSSALNDSIWVAVNQVYEKLPFITPDTKTDYIIAGKSIQHSDSDNVYFVKITNVIQNNQISPLEYVKPTLKELILNHRKSELIKKFEKDIIDDAIKNKDYELYKK